MIRKKPIYLETDLRYLLVTYNLSTIEGVEHMRDKSAKGRYAFTVENDPVFGDTLIQVTSRGCVNIYTSEDAPKEEIVEKTLRLLSRANNGPVKVLRRKEASPGQSYGTEGERRTPLHHSELLILGLEYLLLEDKPMWLAERHSSAWSSKVETRGERMSQFAEEHLDDKKYSTVHRKLIAHRRLNSEIKRDYEEGRISRQVFDAVINAVEMIGEGRHPSEEEERQIEEIMKKKWVSYKELANDVRLLEDKVRHGRPLGGKCLLCRD